MQYTFSDGIYRTTNTFCFTIKYKGEIIVLVVPEGFAWNGVTGFKTTKKTLVPSLVHDYLIYDERINGNKRFTRKEMDEIFIILCRIYQVPKYQIGIFKLGLNVNRNILMG